MSPTDKCRLAGRHLSAAHESMWYVRTKPGNKTRYTGLSWCLSALVQLQSDMEDALFRAQIEGADTHVFYPNADATAVRSTAAALASLDAALEAIDDVPFLKVLKPRLRKIRRRVRQVEAYVTRKSHEQDRQRQSENSVPRNWTRTTPVVVGFDGTTTVLPDGRQSAFCTATDHEARREWTKKLNRAIGLGGASSRNKGDEE